MTVTYPHRLSRESGHPGGTSLFIEMLLYKLAKSPQVNVLKPELIVPEGKRLPHTYPGKRLCLYYPGIGDWRGDMLLAETIVPWISEWLYFYEIWLVTGEWYGGGIHPRKEHRNSFRTPYDH